MSFMKHIPKMIALAIVLLIGWQMYAYFFDKTVACVVVNGVNENCYYCGDVRCAVQADKKGDISLWLDTQNLANNVRIKAHQDGQAFTIPTKTLSNGKHVLKAEFVDTSFNANKTVSTCEFYVDNVPLQAVFVKTGSPYKVFQGENIAYSIPGQ